MLEEVVGLFVTFVAVVVVKFEPVDDVLVTVEPCDGIFVGVILFVIFVDVVSLVYVNVVVALFEAVAGVVVDVFSLVRIEGTFVVVLFVLGLVVVMLILLLGVDVVVVDVVVGDVVVGVDVVVVVLFRSTDAGDVKTGGSVLCPF